MVGETVTFHWQLPRALSSAALSQRQNHFPYSATSMHSWFNCLDHFGTRKMNEIGQHLVQLSCCHRLCVSDTYFNMKSYHRVCWRHPKSKHCH